MRKTKQEQYKQNFDAQQEQNAINNAFRDKQLELEKERIKATKADAAARRAADELAKRIQRDQQLYINYYGKGNPQEITVDGKKHNLEVGERLLTDYYNDNKVFSAVQQGVREQIDTLESSKLGKGKAEKKKIDAQIAQLKADLSMSNADRLNGNAGSFINSYRHLSPYAEKALYDIALPYSEGWNSVNSGEGFPRVNLIGSDIPQAETEKKDDVTTAANGGSSRQTTTGTAKAAGKPNTFINTNSSLKDPHAGEFEQQQKIAAEKYSAYRE